MGLTIGIELTKRCNFKCRHCFVDAGKPHAFEMNTTEMNGVIRDLAAFGCDMIGWSGGEPLLRKDIVELTETASSFGIPTGLATNGFLVTDEKLTTLKSAGMSVVQVSIDAATAERAERFRKGPSAAFDRAVKAIETCAALGYTTYVCTILSPQTAGEIDEMVAFARSIGASGLRYTMWAPVGRAEGEAYDEAAWGSSEMAHFLAVNRKSWMQSDFRVLIDCPTGPLPWHSSYGCTAGSGTAYITAAGDVYPCTALMAPTYLIGNLRRRSLAELLDDQSMLAVHDEIAARPPNGACGDCEFLVTCGGGCPGRTVAAYGSLDSGNGRIGMPACLWRLHGGAATLAQLTGRRSSPH